MSKAPPFTRLKPGLDLLWVPLALHALPDPLGELLIPEEMNLPAHRQVSRAWIRWALGSLLKVNPKTLSFHAGTHGKPSLESDPRLEFNISHSGDWLLFASSEIGPVGVDLETVRARKKLSEMTDRFFFDAEKKAFAAKKDTAQVELFFKYWTAKEAYLKAHGGSIFSDLSQVELRLDPTGEPVGYTDAKAQLFTYVPAPGFHSTICLLNSTR